MYKDLSLKEKAKVLLYGSKLGLTSVEDIAKLYDDAIGHKFLGDTESQMNNSSGVLKLNEELLDFVYSVPEVTVVYDLPKRNEDKSGFDKYVQSITNSYINGNINTNDVNKLPWLYRNAIIGLSNLSKGLEMTKSYNQKVREEFRELSNIPNKKKIKRSWLKTVYGDNRDYNDIPAAIDNIAEAEKYNTEVLKKEKQLDNWLSSNAGKLLNAYIPFFDPFKGDMTDMPSQAYRYYLRHFKNDDEYISGNGTDIVSLNDNVIRLTPTSNQSTALFNEFVERANPSVRKASDYKNNNAGTFGDSNIPIQNISLYQGIENGVFKVAPIEQFNDNTDVYPVRNIRKAFSAPIKNIDVSFDVNPTYPNSAGINYRTRLEYKKISNDYKTTFNEIALDNIDNLIEEAELIKDTKLVDKLQDFKKTGKYKSFYGLEYDLSDLPSYPNISDKAFSGTKSLNKQYFEQIDNELVLLDSIFQEKQKQYPSLFRDDFGTYTWYYNNIKDKLGKYNVTDINDSTYNISNLNAAILDNKMVLGNPNGGVFIGKFLDISKPLLDSLNAYLLKNPSWLARPDLGSFDQYRLDSPSLGLYLRQYFEHPDQNDPNVFVVGTTQPNKLWSNSYAKGGKLVLDNNGYYTNSKDKDILIQGNSTGTNITMKGIPFKIAAWDNLGNYQELEPNGEYYFPGSMVREHALQEGGNTLKYLNVPEYNIALYNTVSPLGDFPNFWEALAYKRLVKDKLKNGNIYERDYKVGDTQGEKTAMAAWAKRLGIPYDEQDLPIYNGDTVTLPYSLVLEIPYDTNVLKNRIELNKALLDKYSKYRYSDVVDAAIKADLYNLDKLRETYKTGKPVGLTEFGWNSRQLVNNGEILPIEDIYSPLNVLGNYNVRYDKPTNRLYYSDEYDFNQFENYVPGEPFRIRGYIDLNNKALGGNLFATRGPKKKLKSPEEILAEKYGVEPVVDNTSFVASPITIQDKKDVAKYKEEQRKQEVQRQLNAKTPILKADVVSEEDRRKYRNQAEWAKIKSNADEAATNFGYSIGANHPMTADEVNTNTLGALETAGWMIAPELMGLGATGYYMATDRPEKAAITAALSLGPGIIKGIKGANNTRLLNQEVKEMDKALELWKGNNSTPFNETHIIHSPYNNSKSVSNTSTLDYNTAQQIQSFTDARNKFAQKHNLPIIGYNYNQPLEDLYNEGKQVIKDANAFYRGVNFWKEAAEGVGILDEKAFKEYAATHPWEGARDIWITPKKEYAGLYGDPIRVVRPYKLGKNPINWFNEGDFDFKLADGLRTPNATEGIYMPWRDEPKEWWRWHTIDEPYIKSFNPREEAELLYIGDKPLNIYKKGGSIHIKPENRGKFTALKKRTGHSASWFKAHGTPALRKMATFELNSRHWNKHALGGHLFLEKGFMYPQDDLTGRNILTSPIIPPNYYNLFTVPKLEPKKPLPLQPLEGTYGNKYSELIPMSDGTYVNNPINKGLQQDWRTHALEFAPFLAIGAGPAIGSTATWLATSKPALYNLGRMTLGSEIGGRGVDLASNLFTGNTWGLNIGNVVEGATGWNPNNTLVGQFVTESLNPGYYIAPSHIINGLSNMTKGVSNILSKDYIVPFGFRRVANDGQVTNLLKNFRSNYLTRSTINKVLRNNPNLNGEYRENLVEAAKNMVYTKPVDGKHRMYMTFNGETPRITPDGIFLYNMEIPRYDRWSNLHEIGHFVDDVTGLPSSNLQRIPGYRYSAFDEFTGTPMEQFADMFANKYSRGKLPLDIETHEVGLPWSLRNRVDITRNYDLADDFSKITNTKTREVFNSDRPRLYVVSRQYNSGNTRGLVPEHDYIQWAPEQWTAAQDAAIARGDMAEALRLRDLHFKVNAPNTQLSGSYYRSERGDKLWNVFDMSRAGTNGSRIGTGIYFFNDANAVKNYGDDIRRFYVNSNKVVEDIPGPKLFGMPESTISKFKNHKVPALRKAAENIEGADVVHGIDESWGIPLDEWVVKNPNQIKLADAVTYDDNGIRIPLSLRDNFKFNDIRYGLIPLGGIGLYGLQNKVNKQYN